MLVIYSPPLPPVHQDPEALAVQWGYRGGVVAPRKETRKSSRTDPKAIARLWGYR